jgi:hypothetical protein
MTIDRSEHAILHRITKDTRHIICFEWPYHADRRDLHLDASVTAIATERIGGRLVKVVAEFTAESNQLDAVKLAHSIADTYGATYVHSPF